MKREIFAFIFSLVSVLSGCANLSPSATPTPATQLSTLIPIPTATFLPPSGYDLALGENFVIDMQSVVTIYNGHKQISQTIRLQDATLTRGSLAGYILGIYSESHQVYVVVSLPINFQIRTYNMTQALETYPAYSAPDPSKASAIFRDLPAELSAFGEPETEGESCNQFVFGHVTLTSTRPLQGNFQFNCQFEDGVLSAVSGVFSQ